MNKYLIFSIIFATVAISASIVFLGYQLEKNNISTNISQDAITKGIESYIAQQQQNSDSKQVAQQKISDAKAKNVKPPSPEDHLRGNPDAIISLIEYSDFECPFCKRFHPTATALIKKYPNKINWIYRQFPLGFHQPLAGKESIASECASEIGGNNMFWQYADKIFAKTKSNGNGLISQDLLDIANELGIDSKKFGTCINSGKYDKHIKDDIENGTKSGITGTPGNIIRNNKTGDVISISGAYPLEVLEQAMQELLKK